MRAQGLKTQTYKTGGAFYRVLLCALMSAAIWAAFAFARAKLGIPLAFSIQKESVQTQAAPSEAKESVYLTNEISLTGRAWYALQLGAFTQENAAWQLSQEFITRGAAGYVWRDENIYRVYAAAYPTRAEAQSVQTRLSDQGVTTYIQPLSEPEITLRAAGSEREVVAVREAISYLDALSTKLYTLSTALDAGDMDAASALSALESECMTCHALVEALEKAFDQTLPAEITPLKTLLEALYAEKSAFQNNMSAARVGAALKRCQLTATAGIGNFVAGLSAQP